MSPKAVWSPTDIDKLLEILKEEKASAGNGGNFKKATFRKAAEELEKIREKGGPKTGTVCESKWQKLRQTYHVVAALSAQSGFHWDDEHGADINEDSEAVWQAYILAHPDAAPFRNKGWEYFEKMKSILRKYLLYM
ncbi:hypothetical protein FOMPIDRAFT_1044759 [Fomitopsis schrenkii]|uniref:Myb/SANT-like domain-containing protein n=1 Tax=Fomitopsis schrenkii TaxID=2126942 RepID=S8EQY8_FOMSC|nr:hypothetical protein FOMPIDRAFT_1044759 [Fomitopsis schrenkii]